jgi:glycosyltransferase involved in cell wall biosynthesis
MRWNSGVQTLGQQSRDEVHALMAQAAVLIVPSICLDAGPLTMLEAFSCGTPVIAADIGGMAERIRDGYNGLLFRAGDAEDLAAKVRYVFDHPEHLAQMRINARREYEEKYTPERNYKMLMAIYEQAIENAQRRRRKAS